MSVNESSSTPYIPNRVSISPGSSEYVDPGSLDEIERVEVTGVEEVNYNLSTLNLCSHDKSIAKKVFTDIFSKAMSTYGTGAVIPPAMQGIQREE